jgi:hypothetical protein
VLGNGDEMTFRDSLRRAEAALVNQLESMRGIDNTTGKGDAAEALVEKELLLPFLPFGFSCNKGSVVSLDAPDQQSPAIDRVIYDPGAAPPLLFRKEHSIFPIEAVAGVVEITLSLDDGKLREDLAKIAKVRAMRLRRYVVPLGGSIGRVTQVKIEHLAARSFIVGLPSSPAWRPKTIAESLRAAQVELGFPTHLHGLYVPGVGFFETVAVEDGLPEYKIRGWSQDDRLFRFTNAVHIALQRWPRQQELWAPDLDSYMAGDSDVLVE